MWINLDKQVGHVVTYMCLLVNRSIPWDEPQPKHTRYLLGIAPGLLVETVDRLTHW